MVIFGISVKILILKPSSLGDVVQALPVARLLRRQFPDATIDWWLNRELGPLLEGDPDIRRIVPFDRKRWSSPLALPDIFSTIRSLRSERYDWVIDLQSLARSAALAWIASGTRTIGLDDRREGAPALYDIAVPRASATTHAVDWYLDVLRTLDVPVHWNFEWMPSHPGTVAGLARRGLIAPGEWIAVQPGARWENKRWPVESYAELAGRLLERNPARRIAILGGAGDRTLGRQIAERTGPRVANLCGELSLPEMVEFLRQCALMVTNDTGPMHVGVAVGTPVIGIFGPTNPLRTGPYGQLAHTLNAPLECAPCMKPHCRNPRALECLHQVSARQVAEASERRLAQNLRALSSGQPPTP